MIATTARCSAEVINARRRRNSASPATSGTACLGLPSATRRPHEDDPERAIALASSW